RTQSSTVHVKHGLDVAHLLGSRNFWLKLSNRTKGGDHCPYALPERQANHSKQQASIRSMINPPVDVDCDCIRLRACVNDARDPCAKYHRRENWQYTADKSWITS